MVKEEENRALLNEAVEQLANTAKARAAAEKQRLEQDRMLLQQARGDAEAQFALKRKLMDAQQNAAEIDRLVQVVKKLSAVEERHARRRAEKRLKLLNQEKEKALAKAKAEFTELQRLKKIEEANHEFKRADENRWIGKVAGLLGMDNIDKLLHVDDDGLYEETRHLASARTAALELVHRYVCEDVATWGKLSTELAFLQLITTYYIKFSNFRTTTNRRTSLRGLNRTLEQHIYEIMLTVFNIDRRIIARKLLGNLNRCS